MEPTTKPAIHIDGKEFVDEGEPLRLTCVATSPEYQPEDIDWFREGNRIETDVERGQYIEKEITMRENTIKSTLRISQARMSDAGMYVCRTSNKDVISKHVTVLNSRNKIHPKRGTVKDGNIAYRTTSNSNHAAPALPSALLLLTSLLCAAVTWPRLGDLDLT